MSIDKLLRKAIEQHEKREYEEAAKLYRKILSAKPRHLDANYLLGTLYAENGDFESAQQYLVKASQIGPNSPLVQVNLGNVYRKLKSFELAEKCFKRALQLAPNLFQAELGLGSTLLDSDKDYEKAAECFQKARALAPDVPEIYHQMGILSVRTGDLNEALKLLEKARSMNPKIPDIQLEIGRIHLREGNTAEAADYFREACSLSPDSIKAAYFLEVAEGRVPENDLLRKYAESEFDSYASTFEKSLVEKLHYTLPFKVHNKLMQLCGSDFRFPSVMDLGCGTGLTGEALRPVADHMIGVDISEKMIEVARAKNCYDHLYCGDLVTTLARQEELFDLFIATDVLVYVGALDDLMAAIVSHGRPGALFLFSTELFEGGGLHLQKSGRYAHSSRYVHDIIKAKSCSVVSEEVIDLRMEAGSWIKGNLFVVRLP